MQFTKLPPAWPDSFHPSVPPNVTDVRPTHCDRCLRPASRQDRIILHGHGLRIRAVVVLPTLHQAQAHIGECWERRYRCTACRRVMVVLPKGVMPRHLYSVGAIVVALFLVAKVPIGEGLTDADAYRRQGMYRRPAPTDGYRYNWRSLQRWAAVAGSWWPCSTGASPSSLLVSFIERAGCRGLNEVVCAALDGHLRWGCPM